MKARYLLMTGRVLGALALLFFGAFIMGEGIPDLVKDPGSSVLQVMFLYLFVLAGYIFAWFRQREGGLVMIFGGLLFGLTVIYHSAGKDLLFSAIYCFPFLIPGTAFYLYSLLNKK